MRVRLFLRCPYPGLYSIERIFAALLPYLDAEPRTLPEPSVGIGPRLRNLRFARTERAPNEATARGVNHISGDVNYIAMALPRRGLVLTIHDFTTIHRLSGLKGWLFATLWFALPLRRASVVAAISASVQEELARLFPFAATKTRFIPDPLLPGFAPDPRPFPCPGERLRVLMIGRAAHKNLERQARALLSLDVHLVLVGDPTAELREILQDLHHTVRTDLTDEEIVAEYRACDLLLFASLHEGFGMPIVEAQATGRPVITSDRGAMREVAGGAALLVDPEDEAAIRAAVVSLRDDAPLRERLIKAGYANAGRYSIESVADAYRQAYRDSLAR